MGARAQSEPGGAARSTAPCAGDSSRPALGPGEFGPETVARGTVRKSRSGRRRAVALALVHAAIFAHLLHWQLAGKTLAPLEPSEAMYTLATGVVNAGAVLLLVSLLATLVLGRWFCGWACHMVALQDLCAWLLKKAGIHPKPLRSRLLMWVPLLAGIHLFFFPVFLRWADGGDRPPWSAEFFKEDFWETFPGPLVAVLTFLLCGFGMVYLLGSKGFCTYGCPYGGLFGVVDRFAPWRIRVTDACKSCGHCTAVCTSNVQVKQEVHDFGMVVDPGCMKCCDCVSSCPEGALYFGPGRPALAGKPRVKRVKAKAWSFSPGEEAALAFVFALVLFILRGLPEAIAPWAVSLYSELTPLLFALGIAAVSAFTAVLAARLAIRGDVRWQSYDLKRNGSLTGKGLAFAAYSLGLLLFLAHSAWIQSLTWRACAVVERTPADAATAAWRRDMDALGKVDAPLRSAMEQATESLARADRFGLMANVLIPRQRAWLFMVLGRPEAAESEFRRAIELRPDWPNSLHQLGVFLGAGEAGRASEAANLLLAAERCDPSRPAWSFDAGIDRLRRYGLGLQASRVLKAAIGFRDLAPGERASVAAARDRALAAVVQDMERLALAGDPAGAVRIWAELAPAAETSPGRRAFYQALGAVARRTPEETLPELREARRALPPDAGLDAIAANALIDAGAEGEAEPIVRALVERWPEDGISAFLMGRLLRAQGRESEAIPWFERARERNPALPRDGDRRPAR